MLKVCVVLHIQNSGFSRLLCQVTKERNESIISVLLKGKTSEKTLE